MNTGGVQRSTHKMAFIFQSKGHNCYILERSDNQDSREVDGLKVIAIQSLETATEKDRYKKYLKNYKIDVIINQMGSDIKVTRFLHKHKHDSIRLLSTLRMNPKNFAINLKDILGEELKKKGLGFFNTAVLRQIILAYHRLKQAYILSSIIKMNDFFILLNQNFIPELGYFWIDTKKHANKLKAIPNLFTPVEQQISEKENIILYVGRLSRNQKRTDLLMTIWKDLHGRLPDWMFMVIGDGEDKSWMQSYAELNELKRINFLGYQDPQLYYRKAKILSFTSAYEGFGNVLVEAQQHGVVPVMFNSYSAAPDIVINDDSGFLIKPFDIQEFSNKTLTLAQNHSTWEVFSKSACKNAKRFEENSVYPMWRELIEFN